MPPVTGLSSCGFSCVLQGTLIESRCAVASMDLALVIAFTMSRTAFLLVEIRALYAMKDLRGGCNGRYKRRSRADVS
jgi:hypothetical protein